VLHVVVQVPMSDAVVYVGRVFQWTQEERDLMGMRYSQVDSASVTLADGTELVLPRGIMAYTYFALVPADTLKDSPFVPGGAR
jgi:hypothetical protein